MAFSRDPVKAFLAAQRLLRFPKSIWKTPSFVYLHFQILESKTAEMLIRFRSLWKYKICLCLLVVAACSGGGHPPDPVPLQQNNEDLLNLLRKIDRQLIEMEKEREEFEDNFEEWQRAQEIEVEATEQNEGLEELVLKIQEALNRLELILNDGRIQAELSEEIVTFEVYRQLTEIIEPLREEINQRLDSIEEAANFEEQWNMLKSIVVKLLEIMLLVEEIQAEPDHPPEDP